MIVTILQRSSSLFFQAQEALKEQEASLKKLETEKQELIEENKNLKSTVEVLQKISQVQDKATEQLETANAGKEQHDSPEISLIGQVRLIQRY